MRISDWSSDVCSSDLTEYALQMLEELSRQIVLQLQERKQGGRRFEAMFFRTDGLMRRLRIETGLPMRDAKAMIRLFRERLDSLNDPLDPGFGFDLVRLCVPRTEPLRSEEHTSELQSLMRISYAVFCLKKHNNPSKETSCSKH